MLLKFQAFGKQLDLLLEKNENLITSNFEVWKHGKDGVLKRHDNFAKLSPCYHYIYKDSVSSAAVTLCDTGTVVSAKSKI